MKCLFLLFSAYTVHTGTQYMLTYDVTLKAGNNEKAKFLLKT